MRNAGAMTPRTRRTLPVLLAVAALVVTALLPVSASQAAEPVRTPNVVALIYLFNANFMFQYFKSLFN